MSPPGPTAARILARNVAANWFGLVAEVVVVFLLTPFVLHRLGVAAYGIWGLLNSLIGYLGLVDLGVRGSLGRFLNYHMAREEHAQAQQVVTTTLAFLTGMSVLALLLSIGLGAVFDRLFPKTPPELLGVAPMLLPLMALGLWLSFVSAVLRTIVAAFDRFDLLNLLSVGILLIRTAGTVGALMAGYGLIGLVAVNVASNALGAAGCWWLARRQWLDLRVSRVDVRWDRFREVWRFGLVSFTSRTASTLAVQTGPVIAMSVIGPAAVAAYTVATSLVQNCQRIVEQMGVAFYPTVMKLGGTKDMAGMRQTFLLYSRLVTLVGGLLYFGVIVFGEPFIRLWLGPQMREAATVAAILAAAELFAVFTSTSTLNLFSLGRLRAQLFISVSHAVVIVAFSVLLTAGAGLGLPGLAYAILISGVLFGGIAYPWVAAKAIGLDRRAFYLGAAARLAAISAIALPTFEFIKSQVGVNSWPHLLTALVLATLWLVIVGTPVALGIGVVRKVRSFVTNGNHRRPNPHQ